MGDRVLMQVVGKGRHGPALYGHWSGHDALNIVKKFIEHMKSRKGDVDYLSARLLQNMIGDDRDQTGFGVFNSEVLTAGDSHGDAGVILIDADTLECTCLGGYWKTKGGLPWKEEG